MNRRSLAVAFVLWAPALLSQPNRTGLFTQAQADQGRALYTANCASCHGLDLMGASAPALAGPVFSRRWSSDHTIGEVYEKVKAMPPAAVAPLSSEQHTAILTYMLMTNGYPAGSSTLPPDAPRIQQTRLAIGATGNQTRVPLPAFIKGDPKSVPSATAGPTQAELNAAATSKRDWLYHTHDYSGTRFAAVDQINVANAGKLQAACAFQVGELSNFQAGPIVYRGTMYVTTLHTTVALDAATCRPKWRNTWDPRGGDIWPSNRGVAIKDGRVVRGTSDGYLLVLNAENGDLIWAKKIVDGQGQTFTMAPLLFEELILIGPAGSENIISGWVGAFRISDGKEMWRFQTVPGAKEGNSKSWPNPSNTELGGGAVWTPFTLDPEKAELYVAVTNPAPDIAADLRPGDNLYTNSIVALDVRTGALRWYKQMVVNDSHDYDLTQVSPLFKARIAGHESNLIATVGKDGVLRTIDRANREIVYKTPVTTIENVEKPITPQGVHVCPGVLGGVEWNGPAYNPGLNTLFVGAVDWCGTFAEFETQPKGVRNSMGGTIRYDKESRGWITAIDGSTGQIRWKYPSSKPIVGAVAATSGDVLFAGELTGDFLVLDAKSGKVLYRFNTGGPIGGGVITYDQNGKQYVAVMSGQPSRFWTDQNPGAPTVFVFSLP